MSKIKLTQNLISILPKPENKGYVMCDSWYSCKDIFNASEKAGYNYIGALKTNRVIFPKEHERLGIKLNKFATSLNDNSLKAFISLDNSLNSLEILIQYTERWAIESFFRDCKTYLGLNGYQVRNEKSINRYLTIMLANYTYCKIYYNDSYHFNTGYKAAKKDLEKSKVIYIYEATASGTPIEKFLSH